MNYEFVIKDFAARTRKNLEFIEQQAGKPDMEVYEVTQLVNSMLGLLVFPKESYCGLIPETPLAELVPKGWPPVQATPWIQASPDYRPCLNLRQLVTTLRNGIAHYNIEFIADEQTYQITGLRIWNHYKGKKTWEAELSLTDLKAITYRFLDLLETYDPWKKTDA